MSAGPGDPAPPNFKARLAVQLRARVVDLPEEAVVDEAPAVLVAQWVVVVADSVAEEDRQDSISPPSIASISRFP